MKKKEPKISKTTRWYRAGRAFGKAMAETVNGYYLEDNICQYLQGFLEKLLPAFESHKEELWKRQINAIKEAAILLDGKIYTGRRHDKCIHKIMKETGKSAAKGIQGFVTYKGKFLDRKQAGHHAFKCGQIDKDTDHLLSEDLY